MFVCQACDAQHGQFVWTIDNREVFSFFPDNTTAQIKEDHNMLSTYGHYSDGLVSYLHVLNPQAYDNITVICSHGEEAQTMQVVVQGKPIECTYC